MPFDYKKEYKEFYLPPKNPTLVEVPPMNYIAVRGSGDPNAQDGLYRHSVDLLYATAFTLKMSDRGPHRIDGYFPYVVPPLEGFWWQEGIAGVDYAHKEAFQWICAIRLPDFVREADVSWAVEEAARKKKQDFSSVEFFPYTEGLSVQCMHIGPYDDEPATIRAMDAFALAQGCVPDFGHGRFHHEIYLSDPGKCDPARLRTVVRHPIRREKNAE